MEDQNRLKELYFYLKGLSEANVIDMYPSHIKSLKDAAFFSKLEKPKRILIDFNVVKNHFILDPVNNIESLQKLAEERKSVYSVSDRKIYPAAFIINKNYIQLKRMFENGQIIELSKSFKSSKKNPF